MNLRTFIYGVLSVAITFLAAGCASIHSRTGSVGPHEHATGKVYPGVQLDLATASNLIQDIDDPETSPFMLFMLPFVVIDIPLSFALDTILLPYDALHAGSTVEVINYGSGTYWVWKSDKSGALHGKSEYQLKTEAGTVWGYVHYKRGVTHGKAEAHGRPWPYGTIEGIYKEGAYWNGSFLVHVGNTNRLEVGPVVYYNNGALSGTSNITLRIIE